MARRRSIVIAELDGVEIRSDPDNPDGRLMLIDGIDASYVDLDDPTYLDFGYVRRIGDVVDVAWPEGAPISAVHLGGAGATLPRYVRATRPRSYQVVYEIDLRVVTLAREHLGLKAGGGIKLRHEDGRLGLARIDDASIDLLVGDAFDGTQVPPTLGSAEAAAQVARVLKPGGLYVLNVIDSPPLAYVRAQVSTLLTAFSRIAAIADPGVLKGRRTGNILFVAGQHGLPLKELTDRSRHSPIPERVMDTRDCIRFSGGAKVLHDSDSAAAVTVAPKFR
jgi:SAM-dependent methyltransferase